MPIRLALVALVLCCYACGSPGSKPAPPPKIANFALQSKLMGRQMYEVLVTPAGGGEGRPLLVFLHGYGSSASDITDPAFMSALRELGDRAPVVLLPEGDVGFWHDRLGQPWGSYVLREAIPAALRRSGADAKRVAIGGISMGGFGSLDLGRIAPKRFCAVGGHSPAVFFRYSNQLFGAFDGRTDFARHDLLRLARHRSPYRAPVWIDIGDHDYLRPGAEMLAHELKADGADVTLHIWPGTHNGSYWDAHFAQYLRFYAESCAE
jgi:predicted esterase